LHRPGGPGGRGFEGKTEGSIFERDKAVISPPDTPPRNAGREYGFAELSTALNHLSTTSGCHHFLDDAIKSVISGASTAAVAAVIQVSKVLSNPLLAEEVHKWQKKK
jgi:hypothetical protein